MYHMCCFFQALTAYIEEADPDVRSLLLDTKQLYKSQFEKVQVRRHTSAFVLNTLNVSVSVYFGTVLSLLEKSKELLRYVA